MKKKQVLDRDIKYIVFDNDGTLIDSMPCYEESFVIFMQQKFGVPSHISKPFFHKHFGTPMHLLVFELLHLLHIPISDKTALRKEMEETVAELARPDVFKAYDKVHDFLELTKVHGIKAFVSSGNLLANVLTMLKHNNLDSYFASVIASDEIMKSTQHIHLLAKHESLSLEDFSRAGCFIGDGMVDMEIATEVGLFPIGLGTTYPARELKKKGAKYVAHSWEDLINVFS